MMPAPAAADPTVSDDASPSEPALWFSEQATLLLVGHGVPIDSDAWTSVLHLGRPQFLFCLMEAAPVAQLLSGIRQYKDDAWQAARQSLGPLQRLCIRAVSHCQQLLGLGAKEPGAAASTSPSAATVLAVQSWIRSAAACVASHPVLLCGQALAESESHAWRIAQNANGMWFSGFGSAPPPMLPSWRLRLERAFSQLSWDDLCSPTNSQKSLMVTLHSNSAEWIRPALMQRLHTLMQAASSNDGSASSASSSSPLSVLFDHPSLATALSTLCDDVIIVVMQAMDVPDRPVWDALLRTLLLFARDNSIELWPFNPQSAPTAALPHLRCSHPWALLTRDHSNNSGHACQFSLRVAALMHECGVTVGERGETFTQHLCAEGPTRNLRDWLRDYSQYSLTAGWLNDPVEAVNTPFSGEQPEAPVDAPDPPGLRGQCSLCPRSQRMQDVPDNDRDEDDEDGEEAEQEEPDPDAPPRISSFKRQWLHARGACQRLMLHATTWLRSVGALRIRRALFPHLIPDLHSLVVDYLIADPADPAHRIGLVIGSMVGQGSYANAGYYYQTFAGNWQPAADEAASSSASRADPASADSFAALHTLLVGAESGSLSRAEIVASLYHLIGLRKLEEEERAAELVAKEAFRSMEPF